MNGGAITLPPIASKPPTRATMDAEVRRIYLDLYRKADVAALNRAFTDFAALYADERAVF